MPTTGFVQQQFESYAEWSHLKTSWSCFTTCKVEPASAPCLGSVMIPGGSFYLRIKILYKCIYLSACAWHGAVSPFLLCKGKMLCVVHQWLPQASWKWCIFAPFWWSPLSFPGRVPLSHCLLPLVTVFLSFPRLQF